jgi:hypothetical protein
MQIIVVLSKNELSHPALLILNKRENLPAPAELAIQLVVVCVVAISGRERSRVRCRPEPLSALQIIV